MVLGLGSPIFPSGCEGKLGVALEPTRLRLELPHETGLILRCPRKVGNPLQTEKGSRPSCRPRHAHGDLTSLAPHERLPEILVVPREKTPTGPLRPLRGLQETRVATREESGVLGFPSRRGLTLEFPRETGLILRCAGKAGNPFQTT